MDTNQAVGTGVRVLGPGDGEVAGAPESRTDRFMIDSKDTGGRLSGRAPPVPATPGGASPLSLSTSTLRATRGARPAHRQGEP